MKKLDPTIHLQMADPILGEVIKKVDKPKWTNRTDHFRSLVEDIISQQLSVKASDTIIARFNALFPQLPYSPEDILALSTEIVRKVGISYAKVSYIKDLALHVQNNTLDFENIHLLSDEEVILELIKVKGIGRWTAEMFLMFSLGREDVFSYGDQGLKNAMKRLYTLRSSPTPKQAEKISVKWKPYRTWACRYLWASLEL